MHQTNQHFYDRIAKVYDSIADANEHTARERGQTLLGVQTGWRVLEIGFGTGNTIVSLAKSVGREGRVMGIDVSPGMLSVAEQKLSDEGLGDRVTLAIGDAVALNIDDDSFDAAYMSFTLELFEPDDLSRVLSELKRVLVPEGRLANVSMATVAEGESASILEKTYQWMHRHFPHIVDCRPINAAALIRDAGFQIEEEQRMEIWTMPVSTVLASLPA